MTQPDNGNPVDTIINAAATSAASQPTKEEVLWKGSFNPKAMVGWWIGCLIVTAGLLAFGIAGQGLLGQGVKSSQVWSILTGLIIACWVIAILIYIYRRVGVSYELTTQRLIHRHGILVRTTDRIELIEVEDVSFSQGLVNRMLNVGKIRITSSDRSHPVLGMLGIDDVANVSNIIDNARRAERRRRALMINQSS